VSYRFVQGTFQIRSTTIPAVHSRPIGLRLVLAAALAVGVVVFGAAPAFAHAQLLSTEPVAGAVLPKAPDRVVLHFGESVEIPLGSVRVFASPSGKQIETGAAAHIDGQGSSVGVKLP
jgi:copper transport protein